MVTRGTSAPILVERVGNRLVLRRQKYVRRRGTAIDTRELRGLHVAAVEVKVVEARVREVLLLRYRGFVPLPLGVALHSRHEGPFIVTTRDRSLTHRETVDGALHARRHVDGNVAA